MPPPTSQPAITPADVERYSRQLLLPQFGLESQARLRTGRILIIGLGGLGCPAALYLSGAGVGTLALVDRPDDVVEQSNLHRQIAHSEQRVGMNKVASAAAAIRALNSNITIEEHRQFAPQNAVQLVSAYDVVLDCTDNVASRYLISDACATTRTPLVSGSAIAMEGQLTVYACDDDAPCYRCVFPSPPPPSCVGSCDSAGVLGPVPGVIGTLQALEALKILGSIGATQCLARKLLLFDAADCRFRTIKLRSRVASCVVCGKDATLVVKDFDYDQFATGQCALDDGLSERLLSLRLSVHRFSDMRKRANGKYRLIDVRPAHEFALCHLEEAESIPLNLLRSAEVMASVLSDDVETVFICRRGNASKTALQLSVAQGAKRAFDVEGGLQEWHYKIDEQFPLY